VTQLPARQERYLACKNYCIDNSQMFTFGVWQNLHKLRENQTGQSNQTRIYLGGRPSFWRAILLRREPTAGCILTLCGVSPRELLSTCDPAAESDELEDADAAPTHKTPQTMSCLMVKAKPSSFITEVLSKTKRKTGTSTIVYLQALNFLRFYRLNENEKILTTYAAIHSASHPPYYSDLTLRSLH